MKLTPADKWFSYYIRLKDADENGYCTCFTCGTIKHWKNMECGHYVKRQHQGTRYNEKNCQVQCKHCNWNLQGNDAEFKPRLINKYGQEAHDLLKMAEKTNFKRTKLELSILTQEFKNKALELAKMKGIII